MIKAVLFDFWGTLVENGTYSPLRQTYNILRVRMSFSEFVRLFEAAVMTHNFEDQASAFAQAFEVFGLQPKDFLIEKLIGVWNSNKLLAKPYEETTRVLEMLKEKGIKIALISNTPTSSTETVLEKYDLAKYFDAIVLSHDTGYLKSDPQMFDLALEKLGVSKDEAIMVGDSVESDIAGAENAGIKGVLIDRKGTRDHEYKMGNLAEIENFLQ